VTNTKTPARTQGEEWQESQVEWAERLLKGELARQRWPEADLIGRRKTDPLKLAIARKLRRESTMTPRWIAQRMQMRSVNTLRNALRISDQKSGLTSAFF
jgi:hypothetical protein